MNPRIVFTIAGALILALTAICFAESQERVQPPNDQGKMHISVVGISGSAEYEKIMSWFASDNGLSSIRKEAHFHPISAGSAMYDERYRPNIKGLPTVRVQDAGGVVLYEVCGKSIPGSPSALRGAISSKTEQLFNPPLLPWRRGMEQKCGPNGCPAPDAVPDEAPVPFNDEFAFDEPVIEPEPEPQGVSVLVAVACAVLSLVGGFGGAVLGSIRKEMAA
jgi:hypothetical protein